MSWCFAIVNNRLAEIYFNETKNGKPEFLGHCYIKKDEFKTKKEQKLIIRDIEKVQLAYRNKKYKLIIL